MKTGAYSPEVARMVLETVRYLRDNGFVIPGERRPVQQLPPEAGIYIRNDGASEIPAWGCVEVTGSVEVGDQTYIKVVKPTSSAVLYLFNGPAPVPVNKFGIAQKGPVYRVYKNTGTVTLGNRWKPTSGQYYLTKGTGSFVVIGADNLGDDVFRVVRDDVARLYRFTLNESLADGTADADILEMDGTDTGIDDTVRDPEGIFATLVTVGDSGLCLYQDGKYYVIQAPCP